MGLCDTRAWAGHRAREGTWPLGHQCSEPKPAPCACCPWGWVALLPPFNLGRVERSFATTDPLWSRWGIFSSSYASQTHEMSSWFGIPWSLSALTWNHRIGTILSWKGPPRIPEPSSLIHIFKAPVRLTQHRTKQERVQVPVSAEEELSGHRLGHSLLLCLLVCWEHRVLATDTSRTSLSEIILN